MEYLILLFVLFTVISLLILCPFVISKIPELLQKKAIFYFDKVFQEIEYKEDVF